MQKITKKDLEVAKRVLQQINENTEQFIKQKGEKTDPDLWTNPQNKAEKTLVKL